MSYSSSGYTKEKGEDLITQVSDTMETLLMFESGLKDVEKEVPGVDVKKVKHVLLSLKKSMTELMDLSFSVKASFKQFHLELQQKYQNEHNEAMNDTMSND